MPTLGGRCLFVVWAFLTALDQIRSAHFLFYIPSPEGVRGEVKIKYYEKKYDCIDARHC